MATYDSEQEQLEALQKWWKENGRRVVAGVVLGVSAVGGWTLWQAHRVEQAEEASLHYGQLMILVGNTDYKRTRREGESLIETYPNSGYADLASLVLAKTAHEEGDREKAKAYLGRIIDEGGSPSARLTARLRLARLMAEDRQWAEALAYLDGEAKGFSALFEELRGDIFSARDQVEEAGAAYERALVAMGGASGGLRDRVRTKRDDLGMAPLTHNAERAPDSDAPGDSRAEPAPKGASG